MLWMMNVDVGDASLSKEFPRKAVPVFHSLISTAVSNKVATVCGSLVMPVSLIVDGVTSRQM